MKEKFKKLQGFLEKVLFFSLLAFGGSTVPLIIENAEDFSSLAGKIFLTIMLFNGFLILLDKWIAISEKRRGK